MYDIDLGLILSGGMVGRFSEDEQVSRIYFLTKSNHVVYIGQTLNLTTRMKQHYSKDFDNISFIEVSPEDANNVEVYYIVKYDPVYNLTISSNTLFKTVNSTSKEIIRHISKNINNYFTGDIVKYSSKHIDTRTGSATMYIDSDTANKIIEKCCTAADKALYEAINSFNLIQEQIDKK